jgi:hypothetical protein
MTIIHTPTNNLQDSLDFYHKLQFKTVRHKKLTLVTDGKALIEINPERIARAGIKIYQSDWSKIIVKLEEETAITKITDGYLLSDPSGAWIYLIEKKADFEFKPEKNAFGVTGNYAGISLETTDIAKSIRIWTILGFKKTMGSLEQGWVTLQNEDGVGISLMKPMSCPHLFFNPSLTYFNGKNNLNIIQNIRDIGIPITEEITHFNDKGVVDNIIIRDPGGFGFFLFSD